MLHNTEMTAPPLMSRRMVRSSPSLCWASCCRAGDMVTLKANSLRLSYPLESSFHICRKALLRWLFSVSYQGRERQRQEEGARARTGCCAFVRGAGGSSRLGFRASAPSASIDISVCSAGQEGLPGNLKLICFQLTRTAYSALACFFSS